MKSEIVILVGTLFGVIVGALTTALVIWINKHYEDKRHRRDIVIQTALEDWKARCDQAISLSTHLGKPVSVVPLDAVIMWKAKLADLLLEKNLDPEKIKKVYEELDKITKDVYKE